VTRLEVTPEAARAVDGLPLQMTSLHEYPQRLDWHPANTKKPEQKAPATVAGDDSRTLKNLLIMSATCDDSDRKKRLALPSLNKFGHDAEGKNSEAQ
jgi:hypothetical protein